ncbi:Fe-S protein assembly co-chaperone HscB [Gammaproteobacteria bacterium]|nr:Fe-S protein assembly co-chaperone HscB [Gammaproteobacteria bacterium]
MDFNKNYFEIFGLPVDYAVDLELLADRFLDLQKQVHPDRFAAGTDHEKRLAMQWTTLVNTANETLRSSLPRAIYVLGLRGVELEDNPTLPPALLMDQIELREQLESIEDGEGGLKELDAFCQKMQKTIKQVQAEFKEALDEDSEKAARLVYELQFISKLMDSANRLEEKLLDY